MKIVPSCTGPVGTSGKLQHGAELGVLKPVLGTSMSLICHYQIEVGPLTVALSLAMSGD